MNTYLNNLIVTTFLTLLIAPFLAHQLFKKDKDETILFVFLTFVFQTIVIYWGSHNVFISDLNYEHTVVLIVSKYGARLLIIIYFIGFIFIFIVWLGLKCRILLYDTTELLYFLTAFVVILVSYFFIIDIIYMAACKYLLPVVKWCLVTLHHLNISRLEDCASVHYRNFFLGLLILTVTITFSIFGIIILSNRIVLKIFVVPGDKILFESYRKKFKNFLKKLSKVFKDK